MSFVVIELSDAPDWQPRHGARMIPSDRRPTMLQPSRIIAEQEALRLARELPGRKFVVFEAVATSVEAEIPTHITLGGEVVQKRRQVGIAQLEDPDSDLPF